LVGMSSWQPNSAIRSIHNLFIWRGRGRRPSMCLLWRKEIIY
jgi:hypothetical protein